MNGLSLKKSLNFSGPGGDEGGQVGGDASGSAAVHQGLAGSGHVLSSGLI